jgi:hypothetical protein
MSRETETKITLPTYQKHWIHAKEYGHDIVIWSDTGKITIKCVWPDKVRETDGRVKGKFDEDKD